MGNNHPVADRFRVEIKAARTRAKLSQERLAEIMNERYAMGIHPSAIAKIEAGDRNVVISELDAFADLFGVSTDTLLGRDSARASDLLWAASKLSTNAQKAVADVIALKDRTSDDAQDLFTYAERDQKPESVEQLTDRAVKACSALDTARQRLVELATEFPLPGVSFDRD